MRDRPRTPQASWRDSFRIRFCLALQKFRTARWRLFLATNSEDESSADSCVPLYFEIIQLNQERPFLQGEVVFFDDDPGNVSDSDAKAAFQLHTQLFDILGQQTELDASNSCNSFQLAHELPVDLDFKQALLEMKSERQRMETLVEYYKATIPRVERTLRVRQRASGNGHVH